MSQSHTDRQIFAPGQVIFAEGDQGDCAYVVLDGAIEISRTTDGKKINLSSVGKHAIFGEMALVDGSARSATATAIGTTEVLVVSRARIDEGLKKTDPLIRGVLRMLARNLRGANEKLTADPGAQADVEIMKNG